VRPDGQENQDTDMNLVDQQVGDLSEPFHASISGDRDDDRDNLLTISQLSPRKRSVQTAVVEQYYDAGSSIPPAVLAIRAPSASRAKASRKKRGVPVLSGNRSRRKRTEESQHSSAILPAPSQPDASTVIQMLTLTSGSSAPLLIADPCPNGMAADGWNVHAGIWSGREEASEGNVVENDRANMPFSSEMMSTSECGSGIVETGSGSATTAKKVVKGSAVNGARIRTRTRRNSSLSVNGGRTLRPRSVSNSASVREEVLRASERGRRLAQVRARKEARTKDKLGKVDEAEKESGNGRGNEGSSCSNELKCVSAHGCLRYRHSFWY